MNNIKERNILGNDIITKNFCAILSIKCQVYSIGVIPKMQSETL